MSVVLEANGAQVLPPIADERATIPGWAAHLACDADLRTKSRIFNRLATQLKVAP